MPFHFRSPVGLTFLALALASAAPLTADEPDRVAGRVSATVTDDMTAASESHGGHLAAAQDERNITLNPTHLTLDRYFVDPFVRSGCPQSVSRFAIPSTLPNQYSGGYVGGGVALLGEGRRVDEGVFGVDYDGVLPKLVWLRWTHGRRYQGGTKGYRTDGPKLHLEH